MNFNFSQEEKNAAEKSKDNHQKEIETIEKRLYVLEEELPRLPTIGLDVTKTLLENLIKNSIERIRLLKSEIFFSDIVINTLDEPNNKLIEMKAE